MSEEGLSKAGLRGISNSSTTTLARCAGALEQICSELDANDGEITSAMIARFDGASLALTDKVDSWINYLEMLKVMAAAAKERKERSTKAQKSLEGLERRLKDYVKSLILTMPDIPFRGESGALALQNNPEAVKYAFEFQDKTIYRTVDPTLIDLEPTMGPYVKTVTAWVIDGDRVKADLKAGLELPWARLERGQHLRIRG